MVDIVWADFGGGYSPWDYVLIPCLTDMHHPGLAHMIWQV